MGRGTCETASDYGAGRVCTHKTAHKCIRWVSVTHSHEQKLTPHLATFSSRKWGNTNAMCGINRQVNTTETSNRLTSFLRIQAGYTNSRRPTFYTKSSLVSTMPFAS